MRHYFLVFMFSVIVILVGCNHLRAFPLESEVYIRHYDEVQLFDESKWINNPYYIGSDKYKAVESKKELIDEYRSKNPDASIKNLEAMNAFKLVVGMNKEEVEIMAGKPSQKYNDERGEVWVYKRWPDTFAWYYKWGKLKFENDVLVDIEAQQININK